MLRNLNSPRWRITLAATLASLAAGLVACGEDSPEREAADPAGEQASAAGASDKPNVIVVLTDDQTLADYYETQGDDGEGDPVMPKTQELLGGEGVTFDRFFSSNSISCPSRYTLLNGQYSKNHGITRNNWGDGSVILPQHYCSIPSRVDFDNALPIWLQRAGYRTLHFGRFLNAFGIDDKSRVPAGYDYYVQPTETEVSSTAAFYGYRLNINGELSEPYGDAENNEPDEENNFTDVMVELALEQIEEDRSKPFYVAIDHRAPHEDSPAPVGPEPALRHRDSLEGKEARKTPNYDEDDVSDKQRWLSQARRLNEHQKEVIEQRSRRRIESLMSVDDGVGEIVERLDKLGELDNTYIIFTSDNGFFNGDHRISKGKFRPYQESVHVPFVIRGPGIPDDEASDELAMNVDIVPTIVEIAGAKPTIRMDGRSLLPFARDPSLLTRRPILIESYPPKKPPDAPRRRNGVPGGDPAPPTWLGVIYGNWKLVRYKQQGYELYDIEADPYELESLHADPAYRGVFDFMRSELERLEVCEGPSCRREAPGPPPAAP
jgi:N-acetylglucosamine-6-sulfatase